VFSARVLFVAGLSTCRFFEVYARADLFLPSFTSERPITYIPSHGG
jgi:hypothetical protein